MLLSGAVCSRAVSTLLLLLAAGELGAQEYRFQFLGADQGLTNLAIKTLYQDRKGFLWVSTENGFFRYDGYRFRAFGHEDGIPASSGVAFGEAPDGSILVGGEIGLFRLDGNHFERLPVPGGAVVSWAGGVKSDGQGRTWLATDGGLMEVTESSSGKFAIRALPVPPGVTGKGTRGILLESGSLWYGCGQELCRLSGERTTVYNSQSGLPAGVWMAIGRGANGDLWVRGKGAGVAVLAAGKSRFALQTTPLPSSGVAGTPGTDAEGRILFPSPDGLVIRRDHDWRRIGRAAGLRGTVYSVLEDRDGSLWIGLAGRGLARWLGYREWQAWTADSGLGSDLAYGIAPRPDGSVWVGTEAGLVRGTRQGDSFAWQKQAAIGNTPIHSVQFGQDGTIWLGTETRGVARFNPVNGVVDWFGPAEGLDGRSPYTVYIDRETRVWAATEKGLFVTSPPFRRFRRVEELPLTRFWAIAEAGNGDVWAGGASGLFHLSGKALSENTWERFTTKEGLSNDEVLALAGGRNGDVWVGYRFGGGVDRLSSSQGKIVIEHASRQIDGSGLVYFLGFDARGRLWAGTEHGVDIREDGRWTHLDSNDGLVWDDCDLNGFAAEADGTVWIGTSGGLSRFSPRPRAASSYPTGVIFTRLTLGKRDTEATDRPSVDYRSNELVARFSALNLTHANTMAFRYRLSPLFGEWRTTERRELEFPDCRPVLIAWRYRFGISRETGPRSPRLSALRYVPRGFAPGGLWGFAS